MLEARNACNSGRVFAIEPGSRFGKVGAPVNAILAQGSMIILEPMVLLYGIVVVPLVFVAAIVMLCLSRYQKTSSLPAQYLCTGLILVSILDILLETLLWFVIGRPFPPGQGMVLGAAMIIATAVFSIVAYRRFA